MQVRIYLLLFEFWNAMTLIDWVFFMERCVLLELGQKKRSLLNLDGILEMIECDCTYL